MPLVSPLVRAVLVGSSLVAAILWASCRSALAGDAAQKAPPATAPPWTCRLVPISSVRSVVERGLARSETIRRQCQELAAARAVVLLEWAAFDSQSHARTVMEIRDGVVVARMKLPPIGDNIVLMAHELQHVIEQTRGLDLRAEAKRVGSGVWASFGGYETQAAVDVSRQVADELRAYSRSARRRAP